ncbi:hypothetical protein JCM19231_557 [Vibrio ishigakensis]|uniref:Uncharacterized protein n=1 Tax=Vibrio ishigakensis TaxID=1481914 RepID=A0A0B8NYP7_9VIBR|nr:hypothetical protein JCM19231_557 [Vibrio ishigakensis]
MIVESRKLGLLLKLKLFTQAYLIKYLSPIYDKVRTTD